MSRFRHLLAAGAVVGLVACDRDRPAAITAPEAAPESAPTALLGLPFDRTPVSIALKPLGRYVDGRAAAAEITAYDPLTRRVFVVNGALGTVDVLDLRNPASPRRIATIGTEQLGGGAANSVDVARGVVAVAVQSVPKTANGQVIFFGSLTLREISRVTVGALPDMLVFTPDGRRVLVANEGEPDASYTIDPEGSISVIDVDLPWRPRVATATFSAFNGREAELRAKGVRIYGPRASAAQDFEPEYITVSDDGRTAWAALQENNALAVVDIASATVKDILPLGFKDHRKSGNELDASDRDGEGRGSSSQGRINIRNWPVFGMYQPDAIASYSVAGQTYLVTANEGDAREYDTFVEEVRVSSLPLNPSIFTEAVCGGPCADEDQFGRLNVTRELGLNPKTGQYDALYALGGRSFSIWSADGRQVYDSGSEFERRTAALPNVAFNASNNDNTLDSRSDNKGPEPEGVVIGRIGARTFAFIGLERVGGIMVYDVSTPTSPFFVSYLNTRVGESGDRGPEGITFVSALRSPTFRPLLIVGHETSGSVAVYEIELR